MPVKGESKDASDAFSGLSPWPGITGRIKCGLTGHIQRAICQGVVRGGRAVPIGDQGRPARLAGGWPGGSMVVDFDGRILAQTDPGPGEKVVVAPIDLAALRAARDRGIGHDMRSHLRSEIHDYLHHPHLPAAGRNDHPLTQESIRRRINLARQRNHPEPTSRPGPGSPTSSDGAGRFPHSGGE